MKTHPLYLNGQWVTTRDVWPVINPATEEPFARIVHIQRVRVAEALEHACEAWGDWKRLSAKARGDFLLQIAAQMELRRDEIARAITLENGKPISQSVAEVTMSVDHLRWFAEEAQRAYGRWIPHQVEGKRHLVIRSPIGVVAAISPWNFPLVLAVRKVAPALAAGCPVILKPARQTPVSAVLFAECVDAAKLPPGVFQLVVGSSSDIGEEFLNNPVCRKISFTGSTEVGKILIRGAAQQVKLLSLELGGHAPVLVFKDASLDRAIEGVLLAKFRNTGQSCIAANRIFVQRGIYEAFLRRLVDRTKEMAVGDGLELETQIGPLIDQEALDKAARHVEDACSTGARLLCGGRRVPGRRGYFFEATVLADVGESALCMHEETFAPIAAVAPFETEEEVIERANASNFGLSAYVFTENLSRALRVSEQLEAGMIGLNDGVPTATQAPFGGVKQSGWGRELGSEGLDAFLETKHISIRVEQA